MEFKKEVSVVKSYTEEKKETIIVFSEEEAHWLKGFVQNTPYDETAEETKLRETLFNSLEWCQKEAS